MNQKYKNIAKVKAIERKNEKLLLSVNPEIDNESGIYFLTRVDSETGIKFSYVGQALHIKQRMLQHMTGYQHIDLSIRKHKFYSSENPDGWQVNFLHFPKDKLDEMERYYITLYAQKGYQSRNKDTGGGAGKQELGERKPARGYRDGVAYGRKSMARDISSIIDKHLTVQIRDGKQHNKVSQRAFEKFKGLLEEGTIKED